ncbi:unnamed protein product [Clavelina lepadiformis]|uniref:Uncharacterized protein n=1 Tax=Clavelina lepadiformis TaxID=159417 RepID=A0ABP0FZK6_CLALP
MADECAKSIKTAQRAFADGRTKPLEFRKKQLKALHQCLVMKSASLNEYIKIEHYNSNSTETCCGVERTTERD